MATADNGVQYIDRPYTRAEIEQMQASSRTFSANIKISVDTLMEEREYADDYASEAITGGPWFNFEGDEVVGFVRPSWVIMSYTGYVEDGDLDRLR